MIYYTPAIQQITNITFFRSNFTNAQWETLARWRHTHEALDSATWAYGWRYRAVYTVGAEEGLTQNGFVVSFERISSVEALRYEEGFTLDYDVQQVLDGLLGIGPCIKQEE